MSLARAVERVLIVEDDVPLRLAIARALRAPGRTIEETSTCQAALASLPRGFDLVLLDVRLPDGSGVRVAEAAVECQPLPLIVVLSGEATPQEAFKLAQLGVVRFLSKPFSLEDLMSAIALVHMAQVRLAPIVRACVGQSDMRDVADSVRRTMVREALAISRGNRSEAAKLLRVTRQAIQKIMPNGRCRRGLRGVQPKLR